MYWKELIDLEFLIHNKHKIQKQPLKGVLQKKLFVGLNLYSRMKTCTGIFNSCAKVPGSVILGKRHSRDITQPFSCELKTQWSPL